MNKDKKTQVIEKFGRKSGDTGSPEVQVAILSEKINELTEHLRTHKKDNSTRRGLIAMVSLRRSLLTYLSKTNHEKYITLTDALGLRRK